MSPAGLAVILCIVTVIGQVSASQPRDTQLDSVKSRLATCDLSDVSSKFEELVTQGVYTLADVIISLEGSVYQTVSCASSGFSGFWSCAKDTWVEEAASVQDSVQSYYSTAQELILDIVKDLLTCAHL